MKDMAISFFILTKVLIVLITLIAFTNQTSADNTQISSTDYITPMH